PKKLDLNKSIKLNLQAIIDSDDLLLKAIFGRLRKGVGKYLSKFLKKPETPSGKVKVVYHPDKDDLTLQEWNNIDDIVYNYIKDEQNPAATEMLMEAYRLGMQAGEMRNQGISENEISQYSYDDMKKWGSMHNFADKL